MTRKNTAPKVVWNADRTDSQSEYSGNARVYLKLYVVRAVSNWNADAQISTAVYNGDTFKDDQAISVEARGDTLSLIQHELDVLKAFNGRSDDVTIASIKRGLKRCDEGFFDQRVNSWQPLALAQKKVFEATLDWYTDKPNLEGLEDLKAIYADSAEEAQNITSTRLVERGRFDILKTWSYHGMRVFEKELWNNTPEHTDLSNLFDPAPVKLPTPEPEPESEVMEGFSEEVDGIVEDIMEKIVT